MRLSMTENLYSPNTRGSLTSAVDSSHINVGDEGNALSGAIFNRMTKREFNISPRAFQDTVST